MSDTILKIENITKSFSTPQGKLCVLENVSLEVRKNEIFCLLGYSGCGKSTLLRLICGFGKADKGSILLENEEYREPSKDIIMLFQDFNQLLPWKTVLGNVVHALKVTKLIVGEKEIKEKAESILKEVGLYEFRNVFPGQLSGGMKQRGALARALVLKPKVLVLDEPFASLDYSNRKKMQMLTKEVCRKHGVTVLFVTHDIEEAVVMADSIGVMEANPGRIMEIIENLYRTTGKEEDKSRMREHLVKLMEFSPNPRAQA